VNDLPGDDALLRRAIDYPYTRPRGSFRFHPGSDRVEPLDESELADLCRDRHPVVAVGSNAAPEQLARKFPTGEPVIVVASTLHHHDVVFAARISWYGAIPATLYRSPGTHCEVHTTYLTDDQLEVMDRSEGLGSGYDSVLLDRGAITSTVAGSAAPRAYRARPGALCVDGLPRSLAAIPATGRRFPEWTEQAALEWLARNHARSVDGAVRGLVTDRPWRLEVLAWLRSNACPDTGAS
jgi:hypothetical protein